MGQARTGTDQAHFSAEHIEDLGQFIQTACAQEAAPFGKTGVTFGIEFCHWAIKSHQRREILCMCSSVGVNVHRPKLEDHEMISAIADALLTIKNRSGRSDLEPKHEQDHDRQPDWQREKNAGEVENSFPARDLKKLRAVQLGAVEYQLWIDPWK